MDEKIVSPGIFWDRCKKRISPIAKTAFFSAVLIGLFTHMPVIIRDIPNHDGLDSIYFDQNMITSGRWFLTVACGISSYFSLPWVIGLLGIIFLGVTSVLLCEFMEVKHHGSVVLISGILCTFPALCATFAYIYTLDGYMLAILLAVLAPFLVKQYKYGFIAGGIALAFSLGIYQSYLPFAMLLSIYGIIILCLDGKTIKEKLRGMLNYLYMGIIGASLYYIILRVLLLIQGKELASYQGISQMGTAKKAGLWEIILNLYRDFFAFTLQSNILFNNIWSTIAICLLFILFLAVLLYVIICKKLYRSPWFYFILLLLAVGLPIATNVIMIISPSVTYHLLMRYQWVLYLICIIGFIEKYCKWNLGSWIMLLAAGILIFNYAITDNIAYSNLEKKYEKTYALCIRLADRMEQEEGYERDMPVALIGVVGDDNYPVTDITGSVTGSIIGMNGDYLLYTRTNYQLFLKHYLGITINLVSDEEMLTIYNSEEYREMGSFPAADSVKVVDGILYVKLENSEE